MNQSPVRLRSAQGLAFLVAMVLAIAAHAWDPPAGLTAEVPGSRLEAAVQNFVDPSGGLDIEAIRSPDLQSRFQPTDRHLKSHYDVHPIWLRIRMTQHGPRGDWLLAMRTTRLSDLRLYGPFDAAGRALAEPLHTGVSARYETRELAHERFVFRVSLPAPGEYTAYLRVVSPTPQPLGVDVWEPTRYLMSRQDKRLFDGIAYGILLTLLMYNLVLAVTLRDRTYGLYVLSTSFALMTLATFNGHVARYLFPGLPAWSEFAYVAAPSLWMIFASLFAVSFLDLRRTAPAFVSVAVTAILAGVGSLCLSIASLITGALQLHSLAHRVEEYTSVAGVVVFTLAALSSGSRGFRPAWWYLAGQTVLFLSVLAIVFVNWGWLDLPFVLANGMQIGILAEMVIFSIALSARIRMIEREQARLRVVAGRLELVAQTDPLTGVANRTGLEAAVRDVRDQPGGWGLLMLDLDLFKPVNDVYGHQVGDKVLIAVARRLSASVRSADTVARIGGDEFAILVAGGVDRALLEAQAGRIRAAIREPIPVPGGEARLDCSVGIALYPADGRDLDALLARADHEMYQAKRAQRDLRDAQ